MSALSKVQSFQSIAHLFQTRLVLLSKVSSACFSIVTQLSKLFFDCPRRVCPLLPNRQKTWRCHGVAVFSVTALEPLTARSARLAAVFLSHVNHWTLVRINTRKTAAKRQFTLRCSRGNIVGLQFESSTSFLLVVLLLEALLYCVWNFLLQVLAKFCLNLWIFCAKLFCGIFSTVF